MCPKSSAGREHSGGADKLIGSTFRRVIQIVWCPNTDCKGVVTKLDQPDWMGHL